MAHVGLDHGCFRRLFVAGQISQPSKRSVPIRDAGSLACVNSGAIAIAQ